MPRNYDEAEQNMAISVVVSKKNSPLEEMFFITENLGDLWSPSGINHRTIAWPKGLQLTRS